MYHEVDCQRCEFEPPQCARCETQASVHVEIDSEDAHLCPEHFESEEEYVLIHRWEPVGECQLCGTTAPMYQSSTVGQVCDDCTDEAVRKGATLGHISNGPIKVGPNSPLAPLPE